jgi:peptidoglycan/LPS O-acetylase OafA/YrhL
MAQKSDKALAYHPALDGVRALAVAGVVLFHVGVPGLGGGFLGVDAFFVLSGFLITSLLLGEHARTGRIRLGAFWGRRARRLLPALLVTLVLVAVIGRRLLDPNALKLLRGDSISALFYYANWRMIWHGGGYFAATATPSPLQHTWSLGIEEQFYLIWPLLLAGLLAWVAARRTRAVLLIFCVVGAALSSGLMALLFRPADTDRDYYGTDTRAQALLIGAALAALLAGRLGTTPTGTRPTGTTPTSATPTGTRPIGYERRHRATRDERHPVTGALALAGLAVIAILAHVASGTAGWMYHGGFTLAALAVAAVIAHAMISPSAPLTRFLALAPLVWLGRISYGVYLYHWPLFAFVDSTNTGLTGPALMSVRLAATLAIAALSFYLLESPIRHGALTRHLPRYAPVPIALLAAAGTAVTLVVATAPTATATTAAPVVIAPVTPRPSTTGTRTVPMDRPGRKTGSEPRITFFGDSVSWTVGTYLPSHPGMSVTVRAIEGCGIATLPDILELGTPHTNYPGCTTWYNRWQHGVNTDNPDVSVILLNRWELMDRKLNGAYQHVGQPAYDAYLLGQLDHAVDIVGSKGAAVVLLTAAYTHRAERPDGSLYPEDDPARVRAWNQLLVQEQAKHPHEVTILNLNQLVCPNGVFTWNVGGMRIRSDGLHFTPEGVQKVIAPWLLPKLARIAAGTYVA